MEPWALYPVDDKGKWISKKTEEIRGLKADWVILDEAADMPGYEDLPPPEVRHITMSVMTELQQKYANLPATLVRQIAENAARKYVAQGILLRQIEERTAKLRYEAQEERRNSAWGIF